jgi:Domain of unknown function (DUF4345)
MIMAMALRALVALWGLFFTMMAVRGILDPQFFTESFGVVGEGMARNALRADFGTFFLVSGVAALWAAIQPHRAQLLLIPALLFGTALILRLFGVAMGDTANVPAMVIEAVSAVLLVTARKVLGRSVSAF